MMLHIHAPAATERAVRAGNCLDCKRRSRFIGTLTPWYGWRMTCLRCGRSWCDGEWMPLEFERGARSSSIASAKRAFRAVASREAESSPPSSERASSRDQDK